MKPIEGRTACSTDSRALLQQNSSKKQFGVPSVAQPLLGEMNNNITTIIQEQEPNTVAPFANCIVCGDAIMAMKALPANCLDLIITSPPYFLCREYSTEELGRENHPADYVDDLYQVTKAMHRVLSPTGSLYLNIGDVFYGTKGFHRNQGKWSRATARHYESHQVTPPFGRGPIPDRWLQFKQLLGLPERLMIRMQDYGWILRGKIIWEKPNAQPVEAQDRRRPCWEYIFHFTKSPTAYYFDLETAKQLGVDRDIIRVNIQPFKNHPASFPEKLIEPLIRTTSKPGDIVGDMFFGSGTVGTVSKRLGRRYWGAELNPEYVRQAQERIDAVASPASPLGQAELPTDLATPAQFIVSESGN